MQRADLSNYLIHWIKGDSNEEAFRTLHLITSERRLVGGTGHIKGEYRCVCFTEAPQSAFHQVIGKYRPFGIQVPKQWIYERGGRPVIYQSDAEYEDLPDTHRWRHVRYEPCGVPQIDFTWEREWRINVNELPIMTHEGVIVVPHMEWAQELQRLHEENEHIRIQMEAIAYGDEWQYQDPKPFYGYTVINV